MPATHEDFSRSHEIKESSNRGFGLVFTAFFLVFGLWPLLSGGQLRIWALVLGGVILLVVLAVPRLLATPKRLWLRLGLLLNRIISPLVLALMFYIVVTPVGMLMRISGVDSLRLRGRYTGSYWINRNPPGPKPDSLSNQF